MADRGTTLLNTFDPPAPGGPAATQVISRTFGVDARPVVAVHFVGDSCPGGHRPAEGTIRERLERTAVKRRRAETQGGTMETGRHKLADDDRRTGGAIGGKSRWAGKTKEEISAHMRMASRARWDRHRKLTGAAAGVRRHVFTSEEARAASARRHGRVVASTSDRFLGLGAAAEILGVSVSFVNALIHAGHLKGHGQRPGTQRPKRWLVSLAEVLRLREYPPRAYRDTFAAAAAPSERLVIRISHFRNEKTPVSRRVKIEIPIANGVPTSAAGAAKRIVAAFGK